MEFRKVETEDKGKLSDGYHTFEQMYEHRHALFVALCRQLCRTEPYRVWRATRHADKSMYIGWFVAGIDMAPGEQITYHLPERLWDKLAFALTLERAPVWDKHTPEDVVQRIWDL